MTIDNRSMPSTSFSFGTVFRNGSALFFSRGGFFVAISIILHLPLLLVALGYPTTRMGVRGLPEIVSENAALYWFLSLFTQGVISAVVIYVVVMQLRGRYVSFGEALSHGLTRTLGAILTSFVSSLCIGLGVLLVIIPGLIFLVWFFLAVPVSVVERRWPIGSMGRSRFLTKGHRWALFGLLVVYIIVATILNQLTGLAVRASGLPVTQLVQMAVVAAILVSSIVTAYYSVLQSYAYSLLVNEKDGVDVETIARVFD